MKEQNQYCLEAVAGTVIGSVVGKRFISLYKHLLLSGLLRFHGTELGAVLNNQLMSSFSFQIYVIFIVYHPAYNKATK